MPTFKEVQYYLAGLWLLVRMDQRGFRYLDMSDRGMMRSFWAIAWCLPPILITWLQYKRVYLEAMPPETMAGPGFFFHLALIEAMSWVAPLVLAGLLLLVFRFGEKFVPVVVTVNWISLPIAYLNALVIAFATFVPAARTITALLTLALLFSTIFVFVRIMRMICGAQPLFISALTMVLLVPSILLTYFLQQYLGVSPA